MGLFDYTGLFKEDDEQAFIEQENRKLKEEADAELAAQKAEEAKLAPPDFTKISNPQVRQYMMDKYQKEQELKEAKQGREVNGWASIAGRALEGLNQPTNIRYENSFKSLGNTPKRSVGEAFKYDNSDGEKYTEQKIKDAEQAVATTKADFNDKVAMENYSRGEADYADDNDPKSEVSKQYQALAKELMPNGDFSNASAAKLKKLMPPLEKLYQHRNKPKAPGQETWTSTGMVDEEGYLILNNKFTGENKRGAKVGKKPGAGGVAGNKPLTAANAALANTNRKSTKLDEVENLYANTKWNGPISGRIGEALNTLGTGTGSEEFDTLNQNVKTMVSAYIKDMSGTAAGEKEMVRLEAVMPRPSDSDSVAKTKIKALKKEALAIANEFREAAGLPPIGSAEDQVQQFNQNGGQPEMPAAPKPSWSK